jgi:hypothetical protein
MWLDEVSGIHALRINDTPLDSLPAIIQSNVNAEFSGSDKRFLREHFYGTSYESGAVYINVFLNPRYYSKPVGWQLRKPGIAEEWMGRLKERLR